MSPFKTFTRMTPMEVSSYMDSLDRFNLRISWDEALKLDSGQKIVGEIRNLEDWEKVPRNVELQAVFLRDQGGDVIRWGVSDRMKKILGGRSTENLISILEKPTIAKEGLIIIDNYGKIMIRSSYTDEAERQANVQPGTQVLRELSNEGDNSIQQFLLYRPTEEAMKKAGSDRFPVLLYLHGRGEGRSKDGIYQGTIAVTRHQNPTWLCQQFGWDYPFIIVAPQLPEYRSRWHEQNHITVIDQIIDNIIHWYQGDESRVYATGFSTGGLGAVAIAAQGKRLFAAVLSVDAYDPEPEWGNRSVTNKSSYPTPISSHHATGNNQAPDIVRVLNDEPTETQYAKLDHVGICRETYANPAVYQWLLGHTR